jgi:aspartyl-tRNA(Asn)/glutamyl-tRNA(Gln) amidotransferase subunit B
MPLEVSAEMLASVQEALPELPAARAARFESELGLPAARARELAFRAELADYFEKAVAAVADGGRPTPADVANWIPQLVERIGSDADPSNSRVPPDGLATLVAMVQAREVSRDAAREVLTRMVAEGGDPREIVSAEGLGALGDDGALVELVDRALASDPSAAAAVREGNQKALGPLVGFVMRETKGRADGGEVRRLILERLGAS